MSTKSAELPLTLKCCITECHIQGYNNDINTQKSRDSLQEEVEARSSSHTGNTRKKQGGYHDCPKTSSVLKSN